MVIFSLLIHVYIKLIVYSSLSPFCYIFLHILPMMSHDISVISSIFRNEVHYFMWFFIILDRIPQGSIHLKLWQLDLYPWTYSIVKVKHSKLVDDEVYWYLSNSAQYNLNCVMDYVCFPLVGEDPVLDSHSGRSKYYKIGIWCFPLGSKNTN